MSPGRALLALLIALSVALLPAAGGVAAAKPAHASTAGATHDGCDSPPVPCQDTDGGCMSMASCAVKCFGYTAAIAPSTVLPLPLALSGRLRASEHVRPHMGSPPFRPPRA